MDSQNEAEEIMDDVASASVNKRNSLRENKKKSFDNMDLDEKERTIFVGNVPRTINIRACKKLFSQFGSIDTIRMRSIVPSSETVSKRIAHITGELHKKQNSVNFYVKYKQSNSVEKALNYNGTILCGHRIRVDNCYGKKDYNKSTTVFIGNIPFDTNEDDLGNFFEEHVGPVSFVRCIKDQKTGMGKGFAFVIFKSSSSVPLAVNMTGLQFMKRDLRITNIMKKSKMAKIANAVKKGKKSQSTSTQPSNLDQYKFSTRKSGTIPSKGRNRVKKSVKKAIQRKKTAKSGRSLMQ